MEIAEANRININSHSRVVCRNAVSAMAVTLCLLVPVAVLAQSYDDIRHDIFDATNEWREENAAEIRSLWTRQGEPAIELRRSRLLDEIIQRHVEDRAKCGFSYQANPGDNSHFSCDGTPFRERSTGFDSENMAAGFYAARSAPVTEVGLQESDIGFVNSVPRDFFDCSNGRFIALPRIGGPDNLRDTVPTCFIDGEAAVAGAIDGWDRSPGHRANMISPHWNSLGIGYAEGLVDDTGCTDTTRDENHHLTSTAGCTRMAPIMGQMFSGNAPQDGFYSVATQSTLGFFTRSSPEGGVTQPGPGEPPPEPLPPPPVVTPPPGVDIPRPTSPVDVPMSLRVVTQPPVVTASTGPAMTSNMRATDRAIANLYVLYQVSKDLNNPGSSRTEATLRDEATIAGYGDLTIAQIRALTDETGDDSPADQLDAFFDDMVFMTVEGMNGNGNVLQALADTVRNVSSESYTVAGESGTFSTMATGRILRHRLRIKRTGGAGGSGSAGVPGGSGVPGASRETLVAANQVGSELSSLLGIEQALAAHGYDDPTSNAWARAYGRYGDQDRDSTLAGHETKDHGIVAGVEIPLYDNRVQVGVYAGAGQSDTDYDGYVASNKTSYYQLGTYGSVNNHDNTYYATAAAGFSYMQHEHSRRPRLGQVGAGSTIKSDYDSWMVFISGGGGAVFRINQLVLQPEVDVSYYHHDIDAVVEGGNNPLRLSIGTSTEKSLVVRAGVNASRQFHIMEDYGVTLRSALNYVYLKADDRGNRARFAIIPGSGNTFTIQGRDDRHYREHEYGFELGMRPLLKLSGYYRLLTDSSSREHSLNIGLRYQF